MSEIRNGKRIVRDFESQNIVSKHQIKRITLNASVSYNSDEIYFVIIIPGIWQLLAVTQQLQNVM